MATWKSKKKIEYSSWIDREGTYTLEWEYSTCADILTIIECIPEGTYMECWDSTIHPATTETELYEYTKAYALYLTLKDWVRVYKGEEYL